MDLMTRSYIERAKNELLIVEILRKSSEEKEAKDYFKIKEEITFYSSVISHSYYSIFYAAKALLLTKDIKTSSPEVHKKTFNAFKRYFIDTGLLDKKLFDIYQDLIVKASELLDIFKDEKWKRGNFTYNTLPQANREPAEESSRNAHVFVSSIINIIEI